MERRSFLGLAGAGLLSEGPARPPDRPVLRTALCDLLGIEYPILQSGSERVAGPELVAEVSKAGGLGILAGSGLGGEALRRDIRKVRGLTDRPFGVNLWLHADLRPPAQPSQIPEEVLRAAHEPLNRLREKLGLAPSSARPAPFPDVLEEAFEALLEERVPVFSAGLGIPEPERVQRCHERGIKVVAMVATVADAKAAAKAGADAVVAQGSEAGGHRSTGTKPARGRALVGALALVPQVVDAVPVPVVAAGGIADGRGLVACLALGASGVLLGTRFVATRESLAPQFCKDAILVSDSDSTTVTEAFTGLPARAIRNAFSEECDSSGAPALPAMLQASAAQDIYAIAVVRSIPACYPLMAGQGVGMIRELPGARDVVRSLVREARAVLSSLPDWVRTR